MIAPMDLIRKLPDPRTKDGIKSYARFIVARATSITIVTLIHQNVEPEKPHEQVGVFIGAHVLGNMVADLTEPYVDGLIDKADEMLIEAREAHAEAIAAIETTPAD